VLPAYNEEGAIRQTVEDVLRKLPALAADHVVVAVNDGSRDSTGDILDQLAKAHGERVKVVHQPVNSGYGGALRAGFDAALAEHAELVFFMDSDGQFDISDLANLLPRLAGSDAVVGYRNNRHDPPLRRLNAAAWGWLMSRLFGIRVRDINCAFKVFRVDFMRAARLRSNGAMISTELLAQAQRARLSIAQVPVHHHPRTTGVATGAHPAVILRAFLEAFRLRLALAREAPPTVATVRTVKAAARRV
jgi:glycosyltransferase involved in cell wall biosynthesis